MKNIKPASTRLAAHFKLSKRDYLQFNEEKLHMPKIPYPFAVGSLMYVTVRTRSDIAHAVSVISRFPSNPKKAY